jgi:hypothetical protein
LTAAIFRVGRCIVAALYIQANRVCAGMGDASVKTFAASLALTMAALTFAPTAQADMLVGNYRLDANRDAGHH